MPIIKSAIKKVRKDKQRTKKNSKRSNALKVLLKKARNTKDVKILQAVFSSLDKAAKVKLIHPNKSARLKSRLSKLMSRPSVVGERKTVKLKPSLTKKS